MSNPRFLPPANPSNAKQIFVHVKKGEVKYELVLEHVFFDMATGWKRFTGSSPYPVISSSSNGSASTYGSKQDRRYRIPWVRLFIIFRHLISFFFKLSMRISFFRVTLQSIFPDACGIVVFTRFLIASIFYI
ncbi:hypothetical protein OESDEN_10628 [Oesophagostomum dentatum]|uniref:Uncharacterized protein n=1 Tax=Oesophagostomum dentatum TaxID=61180 RepID=A0A0B1SX57_OESDE|nr:hypothetical protein OESDEN_10628 [Oesophagostomum dentatum]